ncbi:substrate-binding periplasmic protein [Inhella sp.]|uniref:substrate-binding periplasmic protein n=1 Tax=Inhella sp. TaxID=1921806 RepID=UPI0035AEC8EA
MAPDALPPFAWRRRHWLAAAALGLPARPASARVVLRYAQLALLPQDLRLNFALSLLQLALATQGVEASFEPTEMAMERPRAFRALREGHVDFMWAALNDEAERLARPIYIPLYRGLMGQRVFIIHKERQAQFAAVRKLEDLAGLTAGQGVGWVDTTILRAAGLKVVSNTYDALFRMVARGTIDYFPRGALEAVGELSLRSQDAPELMLEPRLLLSYRNDQIFYVRHENKALAAQIEAGLRSLHESGAYRRLFDTHTFTKEGLRGAHLERRLRFQLPNPTLSPAANAIPDRYWM